ncbi:MAG: hypothetical protein RIT81_17630 [Deltaproteobacteria bacterium]
MTINANHRHPLSIDALPPPRSNVRLLEAARSTDGRLTVELPHLTAAFPSPPERVEIDGEPFFPTETADGNFVLELPEGPRLQNATIHYFGTFTREAVLVRPSTRATDVGSVGAPIDHVVEGGRCDMIGRPERRSRIIEARRQEDGQFSVELGRLRGAPRELRLGEGLFPVEPGRFGFVASDLPDGATFEPATLLFGDGGEQNFTLFRPVGVELAPLDPDLAIEAIEVE